MFIFQDGSTLSQERFVSSLHQVLSDVGVSTVQYSGHSFRIGAATTAVKLGVPDSLIKKMGRWKSSMFVHYIRTPGQQLAGISSWLVQREINNLLSACLVNPPFVSMMLYSLPGILTDNYLHSRGLVWCGIPLEVGRVTKSLPCSEPLLRFASLAIAHGWGWCQSGGSQNGVLSGRHVHELRVRDGALVRRGRSGEAGQASMCRS